MCYYSILRFFRNPINVSFYRNFGLYNVKINDSPSSIFKSFDFSCTLDNKLDILSFDSGIGFLISSVKRNNNIILRKYTHDHSFDFQDLYYEDVPIISCGRNHCLVYGIRKGDNTSTLLTIGNNMFGQSADKNICLEKRPSSISKDMNILQIVCGLDHSIVVTNSNKVFTCGLGTDGQTGLGSLENVCQFTEVKFKDHDTEIRKVSSRADTVLVISSTDEVYGWGNNEYGQILGHQSVLQQEVPIKINLSSIGTIVDVLAIGSMCFVTNDSDQIFGWGFGTINGEKKQWMSPTEVKLMSRDGQRVREGVSRLFGSVHYGVVETTSGRLFLIGNYPGCRVPASSNEIALPGPVKDVACGLDGVFITLQ